jgi:hypothetical protein
MKGFREVLVLNRNFISAPGVDGGVDSVAQRA